MKRIICAFFLFFITLGWAEEPEVLYLTWKSDPSSTMTVMWHMETQASSVIYFQRVGDGQWLEQKGDSERILGSHIYVHTVELTGLEEDTEYVFRVALGEGEEIHHFKTLPRGLKRPLRVVVGGDAYLIKDLFERMNRQVASISPDFVIMGGDIAYTEGLRRSLKSQAWRVERWEEFFRLWKKEMVTPDGRMIPIMPVLGNHDVKEGFDNHFRKKVLFFQIFTFPEKGIPFRVMKIGQDVCFFLLDSAHIFPVAGAQTEWLEKALKEHSGAAYKIPAYHIAAYPSVASFSFATSQDIRKFWVPLFEKYGVKISMEHDNHDFKRTYPILRGKMRADGIIYLGDGAWGVNPRTPRPRWYVAKADKTNCYWLLTITEQNCRCQAFNIEGKLIDDLKISPARQISKDSTLAPSQKEELQEFFHCAQ